MFLLCLLSLFAFMVINRGWGVPYFNWRNYDWTYGNMENTNTRVIKQIPLLCFSVNLLNSDTCHSRFSIRGELSSCLKEKSYWGSWLGSWANMTEQHRKAMTTHQGAFEWQASGAISCADLLVRISIWHNENEAPSHQPLCDMSTHTHTKYVSAL